MIMFATESRAQVANFDATPTSGCAPLIVQFNDLSTGSPSVYDWNFGDGTANSTLANPQHNFTLPGQYTVTLTVTGSGGSSNTMVKTNYIIVFAGPQASFTAIPDTVCAGSPITFTSTSTQGDGLITDYTWTFNDGNPSVSGTGSITHAFNNATAALKIFTPVLLINDANGCNSSFSDSVFVFPAPVADFGIGSITSCATPATVVFSNASTNTSIFSWDFGDPTSGASNTSTLAAPSHTYNTSGSYLVTLTAGVPGCNSIDTMTVQVIQPIADFTVNDSTVCRFSTVDFTNTSVPVNATVSWNFGDPASGANNTSVLQNPSHFYPTPGTYTTTLTVTLGSCTSTRVMDILVRPNPSALFSVSDNMSCDTSFTVTFLDTVSNIATWTWDFGDPTSGAANTSNLQNPTHEFMNFNLYTIKLVVVDIYGCTDSLTRPQYIQVIQPFVNFTQTDSGCVGETFTFDATVVSPANPNIQSYVWNFGDGTGNITGSDIMTHQFTSIGIFDVSLTITTTDGCTATTTKIGFIRVGTQPNANFSAAPTSICFDQNVQFTDLTPPVVTGWLWFFGDGQSSTAQNPNHQYKYDTSGVADPFNVTLIAFYNGCPDTLIQNDMITVLAPIPDFEIAYDCANPYTITFTNQSGGATSYNWDFGDGSANVSTTDPVHTYANTGTFNVTLTATSTVTGCVIDSVLPVNITVPTAVVTVNDTTACNAGTIQFSSAGSLDVSSLMWTFGEGIAGVRDTSIASDTLHLYTRPGYYTATLTVTDIHGCTAVQTELIHILGPTAGFTASPTGGCAPINVTFTDTSLTEGGAINQWVWNYGGGVADTTSSVGVVSHPYTNPGLYTIRLIVTDVNGCTDTLVTPNYINPSRPTAAISNDTLGCRDIGEIFNATAGSAASPVTYTWDFGDSSAPVTVVGSSTTSHSYSSNGLYPVYLVLEDANGCRDSIIKNIYIYTTPASFTVTSIDSCVSAANGLKKAVVISQFHSDSNTYVTNYNWDLTVFNEPNWPSADFTYNYDVPPGSYDATLIVTNSLGCSDTATVVGAVVVAGPTGSFSFAPTTGCAPLTVNFTGVASGSTTYAWDFNDGNVIDGSTQLSLSHTYYAADVYTPQFYLGFQLTNSFCYIPTPTAGTITVTSLITADIDSTLMCITDGGESTLNVSVSDPSFGPYTYTWNPAAFVSPVVGNNTMFTINTSGQSQYYTVAVGYGSQGCAAFDSVRIDYCPCLDILDSIPNVFTPNGDNVNDFYEMKALCYFEQFRIVIFNRWGKLMYESNNPYFKWDGRTDGGTECSEGVYYWIMDTKSGQKHGYLELIRK